MNFVIVISFFALGLFLLSFFTKRRFGALGLALGAGSLLSTLWVGNLTPIIEQSGVVLVAPPLSSVVSASLILLPAIVLLVSGPKYKIGWQRLIGSIMFAVLATALLIDVFGSALVLDDTATAVYDQILQYKNVLISAGLILAILDLLATKTPKALPEKDKK